MAIIFTMVVTKIIIIYTSCIYHGSKGCHGKRCVIAFANSMFFKSRTAHINNEVNTRISIANLAFGRFRGIELY